MNGTQRGNIAKLWTPAENVSIPQYVAMVEEQLKQIAKADLSLTRINGSHIVAATRHGNMHITADLPKGKKTQYTINTQTGTQYQGAAAGAVEFLVNAYVVVAE